MKLFVSALLILLAVGQGSCDADAWDAVKVKWPFSSDMPFTIEEAEKQRYVKVADDDADNCTVAGKPVGIRYQKPGCEGVVVLYDINGKIVGLQTHYRKDKVPKDLKTWFEKSDLLIPDNVGGKDTYSVTAYLVTEDTVADICTAKDIPRKSLTFKKKEGLMPIPNNQEDVDTSTWKSVKCTWTMGTHFWYNTSLNMECDNWEPVFLLYRQRQLAGWGFASFADSFGVPCYENPPAMSFWLFIEPVPKCLTDWGGKYGVSTTHVFLTKDGSNYWGC